MVYNITMLSEELIKKLKSDNKFQEFQEHVLEQMRTLDSISDIDDEDLNNTDLGEIVRARSIAIVILRNVLSPVIDFNEVNPPSEEAIKRAESRYGF